MKTDMDIFTRTLEMTPVLDEVAYRRAAASYHAMAAAINLGQPDNLEIQAIDVRMGIESEPWHLEYVGLGGLTMVGLLSRQKPRNVEYPDVEVIVVKSVHLKHDTLSVLPVLAWTNGLHENDQDAGLYARLTSAALEHYVS